MNQQDKPEPVLDSLSPQEERPLHDWETWDFALGLIRQWIPNVCADQASDLNQALRIIVERRLAAPKVDPKEEQE